MKSKAILCIGALMTALPAIAVAQTQTAPASSTAQPGATATASAKVTAGANVSDTSGGNVGTIESVSGDLAVLNTGANKVSLPLSSFAAGANGPVIAMTKAEVDAAASGAAAQDKAALAAALVPGAKVSGPQGGPVGTIEANDGSLVTLSTGKSKVKLPTSAFAKGTDGVVVSMTAAQIEEAAKGAATGG